MTDKPDIAGTNPPIAAIVKRAPSPPSPDRAQLWREAMRGLSKSTLRAYQGDWRRFAQWLERADGPDALQHLVAFDEPYEPRRIVAEYRDHLDDIGRAPGTRARAIRAINSVLQRAHFVGRIVWTLNVTAGGAQRVRDVRGPTEVVWQRLLTSVRERTDPAALHDITMLHALRTLALRASEVTRIAPSHFNAEYRTVAVVGKGNKLCDVEVGADLWDLFMRLIERNGASARFVFGPPDTGWTYHQLYTRVVKLGRDIDLSLWPHALRHSGITAAARMNPDIATLQRFSRHEKREVLLIYIDAISEDAKKLAEDMARS